MREKGYKIALFEKEVYFKKSDMRVLGNTIYFEGVDLPPSWNFASCQSSFEYNMKSVKGRAIPAQPITFSRQHNVLVLSLDAYSNGFTSIPLLLERDN